MPSFDATSETAVATLPELASTCPCCSFVQTPCCPDRRLPTTLFGTFLEDPSSTGSCSCSIGRTLIFNYSTTPVTINPDTFGSITLTEYWLSFTTTNPCFGQDVNDPNISGVYLFYLTCFPPFGWVLFPFASLTIAGVLQITQACGPFRSFNPGPLSNPPDLRPLCSNPLFLLYDRTTYAAPSLGGGACCNDFGLGVTYILTITE
jgi:hypothetical protein